MYTCTFRVSMGGGIFRSLLCHYLGSSPKWYFLNVNSLQWIFCPFWNQYCCLLNIVIEMLETFCSYIKTVSHFILWTFLHSSVGLLTQTNFPLLLSFYQVMTELSIFSWYTINNFHLCIFYLYGCNSGVSWFISLNHRGAWVDSEMFTEIVYDIGPS